jgi:hypothetical protein
MDRVMTVAARLLGVELGDHAVPAYCVQISSDKYQKKVQKCGDLNRMRSGDKACEALLLACEAPAAAKLVCSMGKWVSQSNPAGCGAMNRNACWRFCCDLVSFPLFFA